MKRFRKVVLWSAGSLVGLLLLLMLLGYLFEDKIHLMAIKELGKALNARIEVRETSVSFIKSWPSVRVELKGLTINPVKEHYAQDVIAVERARFKINFWSIFSDEYKISEVRLDQPKVWMEYDKSGQLNFADMFQPKADSTEKGDTDSTDIVFDLRAVRLYDGEFVYRDRRSGQHIRLDSIQLALDGDFSAEQTEIESQFALHLDNWYTGRMSWATNKHVQAKAVIDARFGKDEAYRLKEAELTIAAVTLALRGKVHREGKAYRMDLDFATNESTFASFLSLLPGGLLDTGREYDYSGDFRAKGYLRGRAGPGEAPDVHLDYTVNRGAFHYVGYDSRLSEVALKGSFDWDNQHPELSAFKIEDFNAKLRGRAISGNFLYTDFTAPLLNFALKGAIGLEDIRDFYPAFADSTDLKGLVTADVQLEGRLAAFKEKRYRDVHAIGSLAFDGVRIADRRLRNPLEQLNGKVVIDNHRLQVSQLAGKLGSSDFLVRGTVTEYLSWFFQDTSTVRGIVELNSQRLLVDEWFHADSKTSSGSEEQEFVFRFPQGLDFQIRVNVGEFKLASFHARDMKGMCRLQNKLINLESLSMNTLDGSVQVTGSLKAAREDLCLVNVDAVTNNIDINKTFKTFDQLAAFALVKDHLYGRYSGTVHISGALDQSLNLTPESLVSFGNVSLKEAKLVEFEPLEGLAGFVKLDDLRFIEFSDLNTDFRIEHQYFYIPKMNVKANRYNLEVSGRHGFDNSLDYKVYVELPRNEAKRSRNQKLTEYIETSQPDPIRVIIPVRITGTVDAPKYALEGEYVATKAKEAVAKQGEDLKTGFKNESEELFGARKDTFEVDDLIEVKKVPKDTAKKGGIFDKFKNPLKKVKLPKSLGGEK